MADGETPWMPATLSGWPGWTWSNRSGRRMPSVTKMLFGDVPDASSVAMMRPPGSGRPMTATEAGWSASAVSTTWLKSVAVAS